MRKCTKISLAAVLATANLGFAVPAFAEELATYNLDTMVVTAQRESKRDVDTPASVTALSQQQLVETGASNLFDALRMQSGMTSYSYGGNGQSLGSQSAKILMRGANKGTVVMIDGVPANINENYYLDAIPVESLSVWRLLRVQRLRCMARRLRAVLLISSPKEKCRIPCLSIRVNMAR